MAKMTTSELIWLQLKALFAGLGGGVLGVGIGFVTFRVMLALGIWPFIQYGHTGIAVHAVLGLFVLFIVCPICFGVLGILAVLGKWPFHKKSPRSPYAISLKLKSGVTSIGTIVKVSTSKFTWKTLDGTETSIKMSKLDKASQDLVKAWRAERKEIDSILKAKKPLTEAQKKLLLKHDVKIK